MRTDSRIIWTLLVCLLGTVSASSGTDERAAAVAADLIGPAPTIAFYEVPGCPICARINGWLDELEAEHPKSASIVRQPVTKEGIQAEMAARGIEHHGVAILNGNGDVTWAEQAHVLTQEALAAAYQQSAIDDRTVRSVEAGCARCIYKMDGAKGCHAAVMVDGKARLVSGENVEAHAEGLCGSAKPARVAGHVEGDGFVSTFLEIL